MEDEPQALKCSILFKIALGEGKGQRGDEGWPGLQVPPAPPAPLSGCPHGNLIPWGCVLVPRAMVSRWDQVTKGATVSSSPQGEKPRCKHTLRPV